MRRLALTAALIVSLTVAVLPAAAGPSVEFAGGGVVTGDLAEAGAPIAAATRALDTYADTLGVDPAAFRFETVKRSPLGTHVRGRAFRDGVPIADSAAAVWLRDGRVRQVEAYGVTDLQGRAAPAPLTRAAAVAAALHRLGVTTPVAAPHAERLMVALDGALVDVWRVSVVSLRPAVAATVDLAAADGKILRVADPRMRLDGSATVFDPNPIQSTKNAALRQPGVDEGGVDTDLDSPELTAALVTLPLLGLDATALTTGQIQGPHVDVIASPPAPSLDGKFTFTRGLPQFEATMAYAHLDRAQRYFQELGFVGDAAVNLEPQDVVAMPVLGFDNSFYMPAQDLLLFGAGGVDDGEDAEVILHEYGHAVQDAQVPGWGDTHEGGAMGEGFGDFLAAAYYARTSDGFGDACVMDWDATSYSSANPPCLRRTDTTKHYPEGMEDSVHADGELWSAFLWRVRDRLGTTATEKSDNAIRLVLASHELLTPNAEFGDAVAALRSAAAVLGPPEWDTIILEEARVTGFPTDPA